MRHGAAAWVLAALTTLMLASTAQAEPWHEVEVIAFLYSERVGEPWAAAAALPDVARGERLRVAAVAGEPAPAGSPGFEAYRELAPHQQRLAGVLQILSGSGRHEPMIHAGWRQPASTGRTVYLSGGAAAPDLATHSAGTEGLVTVRPSGTKLHLTVDFVTYVGGVPVRNTGRRAASPGELHYFDHPLLGLLVQVTPLDDPSTPAAAD